jgi:hypothetical protein
LQKKVEFEKINKKTSKNQKEGEQIKEKKVITARQTRINRWKAGQEAQKERKVKRKARKLISL